MRAAAPVAVPGQRAHDSAPTGMSTMPMPATTSLDDPINDDALLTGTPLGDPLNDPLTDSSDTWAGESSQR